MENKIEELKLTKSLDDKLDFAYEVYLETSETVNSLPDIDPNKLAAFKLRDQIIEFMRVIVGVDSNEEMVRLLELRKCR